MIDLGVKFPIHGGRESVTPEHFEKILQGSVIPIIVTTLLNRFDVWIEEGHGYVELRVRLKEAL